jgi:hypothetical protein
MTSGEGGLDARTYPLKADSGTEMNASSDLTCHMTAMLPRP